MHSAVEFAPITALSKEDREALVANLDACLALLDKNVGRRSIAEIQIRSMIAVLRDEMSKAVQGEATYPPFVFKPSLETQYKPGQQ